LQPNEIDIHGASDPSKLGDMILPYRRHPAGNHFARNHTIEQGIENAPTAFLKLFKGENFGKMLVKLR
jgi:hypothetical protein